MCTMSTPAIFFTGSPPRCRAVPGLVEGTQSATYVRRRIQSHGFSSRSIRSDDEPLDAHDRTQAAGHRPGAGKTTLLNHILANRSSASLSRVDEMQNE